MDFRNTIQFICILCQCVHLHLCCNLSELGFDLVPKNLSLAVTYKDAFLTWECNVSRGNSHNMFYHFYLKSEELEFLTNENICEGQAVLHLPDYTSSEVCVMVVPTFNNEVCESASEIITCGKPGTIDMNIQCIVYNISSMTCTWTYSENATYSPEHTLSLQQDATTVNCEQYINDVKMRRGNCTFHDLNIDYFKLVTIFLHRKGSEEYVIKDRFKPAEKEILSPPTNVTVRHSEENLILSWEPPRTNYPPVPRSCFQYQIEKNKELISDVRNPQSMSNFEKKCLIRIRAKGDHTCGLNTSWGQWGEETSCDATQKEPSKSELTLFIILGLSGFIILLTIIISIYYKRILNNCFPRIPEPKNYLNEAHGL
ncbi:granulocyte-macrophage colony-stimulating factor receptor subunit alpha-like isoform X1 [Ranitomeya variabilis]|uniref:granulocyte-macrophage colony-stimulating factor receptor subunit alpha-like isoform X1 n=2 Tax=Ranitomeya variabilis TaxID=490064 RepID=UPI00405629BA